MAHPDELKAETVKRCLRSAQQLGIDMAGLVSCTSSGPGKQSLRAAYGYLDKVITRLYGIGQTEKGPRPENKPGDGLGGPARSVSGGIKL
jgi:hypothetical protein